jgi:hypothetical protein
MNSRKRKPILGEQTVLLHIKVRAQEELVHTKIYDAASSSTLLAYKLKGTFGFIRLSFCQLRHKLHDSKMCKNL